MAYTAPYTIPPAARVMLPTYAAFFSLIGCSLLFTSIERLVATPAFDYLDRATDLRLWGAGYLLIGVAMFATMLSRHYELYRLLLGVTVVWMLVFAGACALAVVFDHASFVAWVWPAFVARACWATMVSLASGGVR